MGISQGSKNQMVSKLDRQSPKKKHSKLCSSSRITMGNKNKRGHIHTSIAEPPSAVKQQTSLYPMDAFEGKKYSTRNDQVDII